MKVEEPDARADRPRSPEATGRRRSSASAQTPFRVLIADRNALIRLGLTTTLSQAPDIEVVGEAANREEASTMSQRLTPDVVLMDLMLADAGTIRAIKAGSPATRVLALASSDNEESLLEAVRAGANGYLSKDAQPAQLLTNVRKTLAGFSTLNRELAMQLLKRLATDTEAGPGGSSSTEAVPPDRRSPRAGSLTPRELQVMAGVAAGKSNPQIARDLHVSLSTVKTHLEHVFVKLKVSDRTQAAVKVASLGLLSGQRK